MFQYREVGRYKYENKCEVNSIILPIEDDVNDHIFAHEITFSLA